MNSRTFAGIPRSAKYSSLPGYLTAFIGVPSSAGAPHHGAENGPRLVRTASQKFIWGYDNAITADVKTGNGLNSAVDLGDIRSATSALEVAEELADRVAELDPRVVPLIVGGDHSITLGAIRGLIQQGKQVEHVILIDQHLDLQVWQSGKNKTVDELFNTNVFTHIGMEVGERSITHVGVNPYIPVQADDEAFNDAKRFSREVYTTFEIPAKIAELKTSLDPHEATYLSIDVDVLTNTQMISTGYPASIGIDARDVLQLIDCIIDTTNVVGVDFVELGAEYGSIGPSTIEDALRVANFVMKTMFSIDSAREKYS